MEQPCFEDCQQVLAEVKALREEVAALRGWLAQERERRRFNLRRWPKRAFVVYFLLALYFLSVGPVVLLELRLRKGALAR